MSSHGRGSYGCNALNSIQPALLLLLLVEPLDDVDEDEDEGDMRTSNRNELDEVSLTSPAIQSVMNKKA